MKNKKLFLVFVGLVLLGVFVRAVNATTYYVDGSITNDDGDGLSWSTAKKYIQSGIALMNGGDTLIIKDGVYTGDNNRIRGIPSGTNLSNMTTIRAETDFGVILSGLTAGSGAINEEAPIGLARKKFIKIQGFLVKDSIPLDKYANSAVEIYECDHIKLIRIGVKQSSFSEVASYAGGVALQSSSYCLLEDVFVSGDLRYGILVRGGPESHHNILRRCVVRWDYSSTTQPRASIAAYGGYKTGYGTPVGAQEHTLMQNCIVIDGNDGSAVSPSTFTGGFSAPAINFDLHREGCISLNNAGYGFHTSEHSEPSHPGSDNRNTNCVGWENTNTYSAWWNELAQEVSNESGMFDSTLKDGTLMGSTDGYTHADRNIIINGSISNMIEGTGSDSNEEYATTAQANIKYIVKSPINGKGATILKQRGVSGTLWGETGYDSLTDIDLWPFPYEDEIKKLFSESNNPPPGAAPSVNNVTRGFCANGTGLYGGPITLTSYIWEYLGNPCPPEICNYTNNQPTAVCEASEGHHCYYVAPWGNDSNEGSFEKPFKRVQHGFDVILPGDYLYLRNGTYNEHVEIRPFNKPQGNPDAWYTVKSYPGEWAAINGSYGSPCPVIFYGSNSCGTHGSHGYDYCPQYWRFENFEVTGGGIDNSQGGSGIRFDTAKNIIFRNLFVHDNRGSSSSNNGGIVISNDAPGTAENITISHCYLKDNACSDIHNCGNIVLYSDYVEDPQKVNIDFALSNNTIKYNLIEGSAVGLKYKNSQWLSLDHTGKDMRYKAYADKIHHNIFISQGNSAILGAQDFAQVYDNIFDSSPVVLRTPYDNDREPFHTCVYNNLFINSSFEISHGEDNNDNSSYSAPSDQPDYHPHLYLYNNIFEKQDIETNGHNDVNIFFTWDKDYQNYINMSTVHIENDLFYPRTEADEIIDIGDNDNDYSAESYTSAGYSTTLYTSTNPGLHTNSRYKLNRDFMVDETLKIKDAGIGGPHPYLNGMTLPSYIGPCPDSNCSWVDEVLGLSDIHNLMEKTGYHETYNPADINHNGRIELSELVKFIRQWKKGETGLYQIIVVINLWKSA